MYPAKRYNFNMRVHLLIWLVLVSLIITGCTTSGCIRATAVDCVQNGFRPICVRECIGDRHDDPHEANLFDINAKYGDVISKAECLEYLNGLN